jgi:hypothetical protein
MSGSLAILLSPMVLAPCNSDSVEVLGRVTMATPYGNPGCLPLSNPTKCRKLGMNPHRLTHVRNGPTFYLAALLCMSTSSSQV